ncbi:MAG TPA: hypothetical protein VGM86_27625 [Thermoanaerobaculia bacterium]|jgi:hypothetical protein
MIDFTINATVTPAGSSYDWVYEVRDSANNLVSGDIVIPQGFTKSMKITLAAGGGGTCMFPPKVDDSLLFYTWQGMTHPLPKPLWLQNLQRLSDTVITFDDHNINMKRRHYRFVINATFGQDHITSPDPTIVNVGTEGGMTIHFPEPRSHQPPPPQPKVMAAAV